MNKIQFDKTNNKIELLYDGVAYDNLYIEMISQATKSILIQTYIFKIDHFGKRVFDELLMANKRGVEVYVLVDAVGSREFSQKNIKVLLDAGIKFVKFNGIAFARLYRLGRRLHHKVLIVDSLKSIVGGINIVSPYTSEVFSAPRLDFALYLEGPILYSLCEYTERVFAISSGEKIISNRTSSIDVDNGLLVKISVNDWMNRRSQISKDYCELVDKSQKSIVIISSYFFPRKKFLNKLVEASKRGVHVRLVLAKYSDWPSWILASEYLYHYCLKNGIEIYLWNKSILHGKIASVDGKWSTIGSFNLNYTSYQGNLEMNVDIFSEKFSEELEFEINTLIKDGCEKVDPINFNTLFSLPKRFFYYLILSFVANFSLAFVFQEDKSGQVNKKVNAIMTLSISGVFLSIGTVGILIPHIIGLPFVLLSFLVLFRYIILNKIKDQ